MTATAGNLHNAKSGGQALASLNHTGRFETRDERWFWSTGIKAGALHDVRVVQSTRLDANAHLARLRIGIRQLDQFQLVHVSKTFYLNCSHVSCSQDLQDFQD